ncbi:uncharacterized protein LOC129756507 isoform X2 [Uranotaenia lowii]|uniref:uncharacterized protein LOC129756507 isoform X2 n=1 Tax=Uranotaenia lowii TaxID=190385 RepID=UPI0024792CC9|nr:uncharacterized protein LOC129756507 isoform X2 [Uranotaenia lowii]
MSNFFLQELFLFAVFGLLGSFVSQVLGSDSCPVFLTLSSLPKHLEDSPVVINWGPECENPPYWIGLYLENPAVSNASPIVKVLVEGQKSGQVVTDQKFGKQRLPGGWSYEEVLRHIPRRKNKPLCFNFYLVSYDNSNQLLTFDCLKIQPNWMFSERNIGSVPLKDLFLPGTHCSGCYQAKSNINSSLLKRIGYRQNMNIWSQLVYGIRYLDFSIGYHPSHNGSRNFWIMNENYRVCWILPILHEIRRFVILSEETLILDFRQFPLGFHTHPEQHNELLRLLEQELGDLIFRRPTNGTNNDDDSYLITIEQMRREGRYIVVTYNHPTSLSESDLIWAPWTKHSVANLEEDTKLGDFMQNLFSQNHPDAPKDIGWSLYGIQGLQGEL